MIKQEILKAMKADGIPSGSSGLWAIRKSTINQNQQMKRHGVDVVLPADCYTFLFRYTDNTIFRDPPGEVVMEDTPFELQTHLGFVLKAYGRVLVTGLGLGCVVRGLLLNERVEHITVIENSKDVLSLVQPYIPTERTTIIEAEALEWSSKNKDWFDCAWHDLWTNRDNGEPHLDFWHTSLFINLQRMVKNQGAWAFNRNGKNKLLRRGFPWMG